MTVKELKDWLGNLPEEMDTFAFVIRDLKTTEEEGRYTQKDDPIVSAMVDKNVKRLCVFNIEAQKVVDQIRSEVKKADEPKPEAPTAENNETV